MLCTFNTDFVSARNLAKQSPRGNTAVAYMTYHYVKHHHLNHYHHYVYWHELEEERISCSAAVCAAIDFCFKWSGCDPLPQITCMAFRCLAATTSPQQQSRGGAAPLTRPFLFQFVFASQNLKARTCHLKQGVLSWALATNSHSLR